MKIISKTLILKLPSMQIDNRKLFKALDLGLKISLLLFIGVLIYLLLYNSYTISTKIYVVFFVSLVFLGVFTLVPPAFFSFSKKDNMYTFLFHRVNVLDLSVISPHKQRVIIPFHELVSYEIQRKGVNKYLILRQHTHGGMAEYPAIDITYLSVKKCALLEKELGMN